MLTQVHELSELLFKVKSGKINEEAGMEFFDENDYGHVPDWDDAYFEDETSFSNFGAAQVGD